MAGVPGPLNLPPSMSSVVESGETSDRNVSASARGRMADAVLSPRLTKCNYGRRQRQFDSGTPRGLWVKGSVLLAGAGLCD
jgi:hypothetical protein